MRILFDLVHPADALFFFHAIRGLRKKGVDVRIVSRRKDILVGLLDDLGLKHFPISDSRPRLLGKFRELIERDLALLKIARTWRPDVMAGFGGVAISHVGKLLGIPSVSFYDTEHARLQLFLTLPFITEWHVPDSWVGPIAAGRTFRFRGSKQFAYLHPQYFRPDPELARAAGWDPECDNFLVRTVAWRASHDAGRTGISLRDLRQVVDCLAARGKVHISSEAALPSEFATLQFQGSTVAFHHLLAKCRLYCGESITVASEATALGVPSLLRIDKDYAYVTAQEEAKLIWRFREKKGLEEAVQEILSEDLKEFRMRAGSFANLTEDINQYVIDRLLTHRPLG